MVKNLPAIQETQVQSLREWQATPVFLPGEFQGQRSLVCYSPWCRKGSDMTDRLTHTHTHTHKDVSYSEYLQGTVCLSAALYSLALCPWILVTLASSSYKLFPLISGGCTAVSKHSPDNELGQSQDSLRLFPFSQRLLSYTVYFKITKHDCFTYFRPPPFLVV